MKINFTIYWFEDNISYVDSNKNNIDWIKSLLNDYWFNPEIKFFFNTEPSITHNYLKSPNNVLYENIWWYEDENLRASCVDFNCADLVLMDFDLSNERKGNAIIEYIRSKENDFFTEILFYSQWKTQQQLRELSDKDWLYCSERWELFDKFKKVIKTIIKKTHDLNNLRWLVMAEVSELDKIIKEIIISISSKNLVDEEVIKERIPKKIKALQEDIEGISWFKDFSSFVNSCYFNTHFWYRTIKSFLKNNEKISTSDFLNDYKDEIIEVRNVLAHYPESSSTNSEMCIIDKNWEPKFYKEEDFIKIRKDIIKYKEIFEEIKNLI